MIATSHARAHMIVKDTLIFHIRLVISHTLAQYSMQVAERQEQPAPKSKLKPTRIATWQIACR